MKLTRRDALALGLGATAASFLPIPAMAAVEDAIAMFTGGAEVGSGSPTVVYVQSPGSDLALVV